MTEEKKQFKYRGKTVDELKQMDIREFAKIIPSRKKRTIMRNYQEIEKFIERAKQKRKKNKAIKTHKRDIIIVPEMIGWKISVYNGREFVPINIINEMLGHTIGEFSLTRARIKHGKTGVGATKGSKAKSRK